MRPSFMSDIMTWIQYTISSGRRITDLDVELFAHGLLCCCRRAVVDILTPSDVSSCSGLPICKGAGILVSKFYFERLQDNFVTVSYVFILRN